MTPRGTGSFLERSWRRARPALSRHWPILLILLYAGIVGFWRLSHRGSLFIDEGYQQIEGVWVRGKLSYLAHNFPAHFDAHRFVLDDHGGLPIGYGKPMHSLLIALALWLLPGSGPTPVLVMEGLFGLAIVLVVYAIAFRLSGRVAAIASAALLATSVTFLAYRRAELPEIDSLFFFSLAILLVVRWGTSGPPRGRRALLIGVLAGCAFTANDLWLIAPVLLIAIFAMLSWRRETSPVRQAVRSSGFALMGFAIPPLLFEMASTAMLWLAHYSRPRYPAVSVPYLTYFQQLYVRERYIASLGGQPGLTQIRHAPYFRYLLSFDGLAWLIIVLVALIVVASFRRRAGALAILWFVVPLIFISTSANVAPRFVVLILPAAALCVGFAVSLLRNRGRVPAALAVIALLAAVISSIVHTPAMLRVNDGLPPAVQFVETHGGGLIVSTKAFPLATYVGLGDVVQRYHESIPWARDQLAHGARWLVLEIWVPRGETPPQATSSDSFTTIGPIGELSTYFLHRAKPLWESRARAPAFTYEGIEGGGDQVLNIFARAGRPIHPGTHDRLLLVYHLADLMGEGTAQ